MDQRAWRFLTFFDAAENRLHFCIAHRHRAALRAQETCDAVDGVDQVVTFIRQFHVHQNVARHKATLGGHLLIAAYFDHFFSRHKNFTDLITQTLLFDLLTNGLCDLFFEIRKDAN